MSPVPKPATSANQSTDRTTSLPVEPLSKSDRRKNKVDASKGSKGSNLIGKINNLASADLGNIAKGGDFLLPCTHIFKHFGCLLRLTICSFDATYSGRSTVDSYWQRDIFVPDLRVEVRWVSLAHDNFEDPPTTGYLITI